MNFIKNSHHVNHLSKKNKQFLSTGTAVKHCSMRSLWIAHPGSSTVRSLFILSSYSASISHIFGKSSILPGNALSRLQNWNQFGRAKSKSVFVAVNSNNCFLHLHVCDKNFFRTFAAPRLLRTYRTPWAVGNVFAACIQGGHERSCRDR